MGYDSYIKIKKSEFSLVKNFFRKENFVFYNFKNEFQICSFHKFIDDQCKYKEGVLFSISKSKNGYVIWGRNWASCTSYDLELHNNTLIRLSQEFKREYVTDEGKNTPFTIYKEPFGLCNALGFPFDELSNLFEESLFMCSKIEPLSETQLQMKKMLGELTIFNQESFSMNLLLIYVVSILENYFKSVDVEEKRLYNSISRGLALLADQNGPFSDVSERVLLVLSDGKLFYDDSFSIDDNYFKTKADLLEKSMQTDDRHLMYYVDIFGDLEIAEEQHDAYPFLSTVCRNTGGCMFDGFNWVQIENEIFKKLQIDYTDYRFVFENPDHKMYSGFGRTLVMDCYYNGGKIASGSTDIVMGSFFKPVLVNPFPVGLMLVRGFIFTMALLSIFFLICQMLIPAIRYRRFKQKFTGQYTDANMSIAGTLVGDTCYYCKAPYVAGDEVVAKCEHSMHMSCWNENGYHCPEYGRNCKQGSHYYNEENRFDFRNAPYYLKWIFAAVLGGLLIWTLYLTTYKGFDSRVIHSIAERAGVSVDQTPLLYPSFSFILTFILTMAFSFISVRRRGNHARLLSILARSCVAGLCSALLFLLATIADIVLNLQSGSLIIDWIPWTLSGVAVAFCSSYGTNFKINVRSIFVVVAISVGTMFLWSFFCFRLSLDYRPYMVYTYEIFAIGIAIGLAQAEPRSERFFLHASGAIKEMDIALYKWFASNPNAVVTIGKSVDCTLEMSWDVSPGIGPKKAEIKMLNGALYLFAIEDGITVNDRTLAAGKRIRLYRGRRFRIGNTVFEYQERDI
mgnify:CR=1 FL=1